MEEVFLRVNGRRYRIAIEPWESLNQIIREKLGLIGTKHGCETGGCGSCTVVADSKAVYSCMMYAIQAVGKDIRTIEGLSDGSELDFVQDSFVKMGGLQCGYCTPGFIMSAKALLDANPEPTEIEIREALVGNLCRCTGYSKIFESIQEAARVKASRKAGATPPQ